MLHILTKADGPRHIGKGRPDVRNIPQRPGVTPSNHGKNSTEPRPVRNRGEQPRWQQPKGGK